LLKAALSPTAQFHVRIELSIKLAKTGYTI